MGLDRQRLDKWLWFARIVKSRTLAQRLIEDGHVRVNSSRIDTPARAISPGDILTVSLERQVLVLKVISPGIRRGPFAEARLLYDAISETGADALRETGAAAERSS